MRISKKKITFYLFYKGRGIIWYLYLHIFGYTVININRQFKDRFSFLLPQANRFVFQLFDTFIIKVREW